MQEQSANFCVLLFQGICTALCYYVGSHMLLHTYIIALIPTAIIGTGAFCYINKELTDTENDEENVTITAEMSEIRNDNDDNSMDGSQRSLVVDL